MYVPFFRSGRSQNSYLRLCAFLRFFRDFFLPGVCKVDQQNACTSKIPIIAPQLSIPTSLTEGPRASTKDWWYSSSPANPTHTNPARSISQIPRTPYT